MRNRKCNNPAPANEGKTCFDQQLGSEMESEACNIEPCEGASSFRSGFHVLQIIVDTVVIACNFPFISYSFTCVTRIRICLIMNFNSVACVKNAFSLILSDLTQTQSLILQISPVQ